MQEIITIFINVGIVIGSFLFTMKVIKEKDYAMACYKTVMYMVVALFTMVEYVAYENELFLVSAVVTISLIECIDNYVRASKWKADFNKLKEVGKL